MYFVIDPIISNSKFLELLKSKGFEFKYFEKGFDIIYLKAKPVKYINEYEEDCELVYDTLYHLRSKSIISFKELKSAPKPEKLWEGEWIESK